jgi:hypothetical protein
MIILASLFLIIFEAIPEALALTGHKTLAGIIEGVYRAMVTLAIILWLMGVSIGTYGHNIYFIIGGYLLMRFAIFDFIYNAVAGLKLTYIGKTKITDKFWQWFFKVTRFPVGMFFGMLKLICFLIGLTFLMGWQDGIVKYVKSIVTN